MSLQARHVIIMQMVSVESLEEDVDNCLADLRSQMVSQELLQGGREGEREREGGLREG